eukprot:6186462-Pleurochrysis_carterae.AAC.3
MSKMQEQETGPSLLRKSGRAAAGEDDDANENWKARPKRSRRLKMSCESPEALCAKGANLETGSGERKSKNRRRSPPPTQK